MRVKTGRGWCPDCEKQEVYSIGDGVQTFACGKEVLLMAMSVAIIGRLVTAKPTTVKHTPAICADCGERMRRNRKTGVAFCPACAAKGQG